MASWKCNECGRTNPATAACGVRCAAACVTNAVIISAPGDPIRVAVQPPNSKRVEMIEWFQTKGGGASIIMKRAGREAADNINRAIAHAKEAA